MTMLPRRSKRHSSQSRLFFCCFFAGWLLLSATLPGRAADQPKSGHEILHHLDVVLTWYRATRDKIQATGLPTDAIYQSNMQTLAAQAVQQAFASALAQEALEAQASKSAAAQQANPSGTGSRGIDNFSQTLKQTIADLQKQIDQANQQIASAPRRKVQDLTQQRDRLQGELNLDTTMYKSVSQLAAFVDQNGEGESTGVQASILQLQRGVPELNASSTAKTAPVSGSITALQHSSGLIGDALTLYDQGSTMRQINAVMKQITDVESAVTALRDPLRQQLRAAVKQGRALAATTNGTQPGQPQPTEADFNALSTRFNQIAGAEIPLSKELILLGQSKTNLQEWHNSIYREYDRILRSVLARVGGIALVIGALFLLSELWKRAIFRYVSDLRRRRQFLLMRRVVIGFLMGIVIALGFVSELSSLATFAGFITAGLAVGLQTILLSVAAYFFLMGRYGIRVGDRITIAGVTGEVADVGLVRLYLMELAGTGIDVFPTGRLVVFSNAVLFQATTPLFKQIPGTEYAWHEVAFLVNPQADLKVVEGKLLTVVTDVFEKYRSDMERQHGEVERRIEIHIQAPEPKSLLQYSDAGLEIVVRYPVSLQHLAAVDDQIARTLANLVEQDAVVKAAIAGLPKLRTAVKQ
jgi:small-conductance mechanosensitive channel